MGLTLAIRFEKQMMRHDEFVLGLEFDCGATRWRCTDLGRRTIVAIPLEYPDDPSWYTGPPYAVAECVFDENDLPACSPVPVPNIGSW